MKIRHRVQIIPTAEQKQLLNQTFGCCRYVYNKLLSISIQEYQEYLNNKQLPKPNVSGYSLTAKLPAIRSDLDTPWLKDVSYNALQQSILNLGKSFTNFFKRGNKGYPKFKSRYSKQSFNLVGSNFDIRDSGLWIIKGKTPIKVYWDKRGIPTNPSSVTISKSPTGKYYASFVTEVSEKPTTGAGTIGIDLGLTHFATLSNGTKIDNPKYFNKYQKRLRRLQQSFCKKKKGSKNRTKAGYRVAKIHEKIANCRNDFLQKLSTDLISKYQVIGVEDLSVKHMVKNRHLSKAISDVSWSKFKELLLQKTQARDNNSIVFMDTFYPSSHICSQTDKRITGKLKLSKRSFTCEHCGEHHDRDINAAMNIKRKAQSTYESLGEMKSKIIIADRQYTH